MPGKVNIKKYRWNEHGVCLNPDKITLINNKTFTIIVTVARHKKWSFGYDIWKRGKDGFCATSGVSSENSYKAEYKSRIECIVEGVRYIVKNVLERRGKSPQWEVTVMKKFIHDNFKVEL